VTFVPATRRIGDARSESNSIHPTASEGRRKREAELSRIARAMERAIGLPGMKPGTNAKADEDGAKPAANAGEKVDGPETSTPARSPGAQAGGSPPDSSEGKDGDGDDADDARGATAAVVGAVANDVSRLASPSLTIDIPTPRGVDQMSPEPATLVSTSRTNGKRGDTTLVDCCYCGDPVRGFLALRTHVMKGCKMRPKNKSDGELKPHLQRYWEDQTGSIEGAEEDAVRALVAPMSEPADQDATDEDTDDDEPKLDEAHANDADDDALDSDSEEVRGAKGARAKSAEELFDATSNFDEQQTSEEEEGATLHRSARMRRPTEKAGASMGKSRAAATTTTTASRGTSTCITCHREFKNLKIHLKRSKACDQSQPQSSATPELVEKNMDEEEAEGFKCKACEKLFGTALGLRVHLARYCTAAPAESKETPNETAKVETSGGITVMQTHKNITECLMGCGYAHGRLAVLAKHMKMAHKVQLVYVDEQDDEEESGEESEEEAEDDDEDSATIEVHPASKRCMECDDTPMFMSYKYLAEHYRDAHGIKLIARASAPSLKPLKTAPIAEKRGRRNERESVKPQADDDISCPTCGKEFARKSAGRMMHIKSCARKSNAAPPVRMELKEPPKKAEMPRVEQHINPDQRWCQVCMGNGVEFYGKSFRQLLAHMRDEHNIHNIPAEEPIEETMTEMEIEEEVCETESDDDDEIPERHQPSSIDLLSTQTKCTECDFKAKTHVGLKVHMKRAHSMQAQSITPKRKLSQRVVEEADVDDIPSPVKRRAVAFPSTSDQPSAPVDEMVFTQLVDSFHMLAKAHAELSEEFKSLRRSHDKAISRGDDLEARLARLEKRNTSGNADDTSTIQHINPDGHAFSPAVVFGRLVWLAGITASDKIHPTVAGQTRQALDNVAKLLAQAGTDVLHLISIKLYVADIRNMSEAFEAWDSWFGQLGIDPDKRPVRNILQANLKDSMLRVELYAHAALPAAGEEPLPGGVPKNRRAHR